MEYNLTWWAISEDSNTGGVNMRWERLIQIGLLFKHGRQHHGGHPGSTVTHTHTMTRHCTTLHLTCRVSVALSELTPVSHTEPFPTTTSMYESDLPKSNLAAPFLNLQKGQSSNHWKCVKTANICNTLSPR